MKIKAGIVGAPRPPPVHRALYSLPPYPTDFLRNLQKNALARAKSLSTSELISALKARTNTPSGTAEHFLTKSFTNRRHTGCPNCSETT